MDNEFRGLLDASQREKRLNSEKIF